MNPWRLVSIRLLRRTKCDRRSETSATDGICWLVSYPKSGDTWLRVICFYLINGREPRDLGEVDSLTGTSLADERGDPKTFVTTHSTVADLDQLSRRTPRANYIYRHPLGVFCSTLNYAMLTGEADLRGLEGPELE